MLFQLMINFLYNSCLFSTVHCSGEKAGSISWELPVIMDIHGKGKTLLEKKRNVLSDLSSASDFSDEVGTSASRFNITFSNWSDSLHLNEVIS